jgi:hypothetical protein
MRYLSCGLGVRRERRLEARAGSCPPLDQDSLVKYVIDYASRRRGVSVSRADGRPDGGDVR